MQMSSAVRTITKSLLLVTIIASMFLGCATRSRVVVRTPRDKAAKLSAMDLHGWTQRRVIPQLT